MKRKTLIILISLALTTVALITGYGQLKSSTKQHIANDSSGLYFKDKHGVYIYAPRDCGFLGCFGPDLRSESEKYRKIPYADPNTFQILIGLKDDSQTTGEILARDNAHVFYGGEYVPDGDVGSLQVLGSHAKDKNHLYFSGQVITGIDIKTVKVLGMYFLSDRNGLYVAGAIPPRRAALVDYPTFDLRRPAQAVKDKDYFAQDKNFYYYSDGGSYRVDPKPEVQDFKKLGCGYYYFRGQVFHSLFQIAGADVATFRVLGTPDHPDRDVESCHDFYSIDSRHRYEFEYQVQPGDTYRNHQIDLLLATPEYRKRMSATFSYICIPQDRPGVNFGFSPARTERSTAGTVKVLLYQDAAIVEAQLMNADGQWQQLPKVTGRVMDGCDSIGVEKFYEVNQKPWLARRAATSISLVVHKFGEDPVFVICDSRYSIKLAFSATALIRQLKDTLRDSRVAPFDSDEGWGSGWILEDKFFLNTDGAPEVWTPLRIKNAPVVHKEGWDFVTVGFSYRDGQFQCVDTAQCVALGVPQEFKVDLN